MRAGNGDGSIQSRKTKTKGVVWDVQVTVRNADGTSSRATKRGLPTREAATKWRDAERRKVRAATKARPVALTVPALVARFLKEADGLAPSTLKAYGRMHNLYIEPMLKVRAETMSSKRLQAFANDVTMAVQGKGQTGSATTLMALAAVRSAFAWATSSEVGLLPRNPISDARVSVVSGTNSRRPLTGAEVARLLEVASDRSRIMWELMLEAAPRSGELLALDWEDFDLSANRVRIAKILTPESNYTKIAPRTKGKRTRHAYFSDALCADLKALKEKQGGSAKDPVFVSVRGPQRRMNMISMRQLWWKDTEAAGMVKRVPHELRHTWATSALANGMDVQTVADVLGHKDLSTVLNYLHMQNQGAGAANALRASLRGS